MRVRAVIWMMSIAITACTYLTPDPTYDLSFRCGTTGGSTCPAEQPCPALALGAGGCEDLPGLFEQPEIPATVGRPQGCVARLPYGNPYYAYSQQVCRCGEFYGPLDGGGVGLKVQWSCPR